MGRKRAQESEDDYEDDSEPYEPEQTRVVAKKLTVAKRSANKRQKRAKSENDNHLTLTDGFAGDMAVQTRPHAISLHKIAQPEPLRESLLKWYAGVHSARGMPWRKPYDPTLGPEERSQRAYEVWISEIMLQQTQVTTVIPYYNKWMTKFPTISHLAESDIETVNGLWKGLGYYSRAARLLSGAKKAVEKFGGRLPSNAADMEAQIPGIGRYSAGAISSIAYNECVPVLDGNVHRLLSRVLALHAPPKAKSTLEVLWAGATAMVDGAARPGDLNQALIELGSTVCKHQISTAKTDGEASGSRGGIPDIEELCTLCEPLPAPGLVTAFPMKAEKKKAREELDVVSVTEWRSSSGARWFLLVRRPEGGLLAGLHEFPTAPMVPVMTSPSATIAIASATLSDLLVAPPKPIASAKGKIAPAASAESPVQASRRHASADTDLDLGGAGDASAPAVWIAKITPAGDVLHVFSHIRKTYRVQWVLLESAGGEPPALQRTPPSAGTHSAAGLTKDKGKGRGTSGPAKRAGMEAAAPSATRDSARVARASVSAPPRVLWTPIDEVPNANIGTGVLKVWKQVSKLWEDA